MTTIIHGPRASRWLRGLLAALTATATLLGCGGGVGTGGTGSFASGPITGYGSILVNGVRYDVSGLGANLSDEDDLGRSVDELKLGVVVTIEAGAIDDSTTPPTARATKVVMGSELVGPIESALADASGITLVVAGQTVRITDNVTVLDDRIGATGLSPGNWVEVYGSFDAAATPARVTATRVEPHDASGARVRGPISSLTATTFAIGSGVYGYTGVTLPVGVGNGTIVRAKLQLAGGAWQVTSVAAVTVSLPEADEAEVEGRVTSVTSATLFAVNGVAVDANGLSTAGIAVGTRVEVEGTVRNGVLVARKIEVKESSGTDPEPEENEFSGRVANLNLEAQTFEITVDGKTQLIRYVGVTPEGTLAEGVKVEVKGTLDNDGSTVNATQVKVED